MKLPFFLFMLVAISAKAQDIMKTKLTWKVGQLTDLNTNKNQVYQCSFITNGSQPIKWVQKNNYVRTLNVTKVRGKWGDIKTSGKAVFEIEEYGEVGSLTFERQGSEVTIMLILGQPELKKMNQRLVVSSVN